MNRKKLYKILESLHELLSSDKISIIQQYIGLFSPIVEELKNNPLHLLEENAEGQLIRQDLKNSIEVVIEEEKVIKFRSLIVQSSQIEKELTNAKLFFTKNNEYYAEFLNEIEEKLESFLTYYENYARSYSRANCLSLAI
jgi:regulator of replication initiation timing